jgi:hypothetical protein
MAKEKKPTRRKAATSSGALIAALNKHTAALNAQKKVLESHAVIMSAHTIALTPTDARGACTIVFTDSRPDYCANNMTNRECQELAAEQNGIARPIVPEQRCFNG